MRIWSNPTIERWAARFNARVQRERALLAGAAVFGVLLLGYSLLVEPELIRSRSAQNLALQQEQQVRDTRLLIEAANAQLAADPDASSKAELIKIKQRLGEVENALKRIEGGLVPPDQMNALLERMLARHASLRLVSLKSLPPVNLADRAGGDVKADPNAAAKAAATSQVGLYKHGVELKLEGSYADLYAWLAQFEASPQKMLWGDVRLNASAYPKSVLTITVFTLSSNRAWLAI